MLDSPLMSFIILMRQNLRARIISSSRSEPIYIECKLHEPRAHGLSNIKLQSSRNKLSHDCMLELFQHAKGGGGAGKFKIKKFT